MISVIGAIMFTATSASTSLAVSNVATLACGTGRFRLESRSLPPPGGPLAPVAQHLSSKAVRNIPLEAGATVVVDGQRVRAGYIQSWACVDSRAKTHYVLLGYACAVEQGDRRECGGDKEWFRLLDTNGRRLDAGLPHEGPGIDRLHRHLGIDRAMAEGVRMRSVLPA